MPGTPQARGTATDNSRPAHPARRGGEDDVVQWGGAAPPTAAIADWSAQLSPAALARWRRSRALRGFLHLRILRPVTCFCRAGEQAARHSRRALRCTALLVTSTNKPLSRFARRELLRVGRAVVEERGRRPRPRRFRADTGEGAAGVAGEGGGGGGVWSGEGGCHGRARGVGSGGLWMAARRAGGGRRVIP
jgi:hypothetical protein